MADVQIPSKAVADTADVRQPLRSLLEDLNLLGTPDEERAAGALGATFTGPPQSVALIEAGATAAAKGWATGLGALVAAAWTAVAGWWPEQNTDVQVVVLGGAALVTAAVVLSVGYLMASDVRGRAAAAVSIIEARAAVARTMLEAAQAVYEPVSDASGVEVVPLPATVLAKNLGRPANDEENWRAVALERHPDGNNKYILVKGSVEASVPVSELEFYP